MSATAQQQEQAQQGQNQQQDPNQQGPGQQPPNQTPPPNPGQQQQTGQQEQTWGEAIKEAIFGWLKKNPRAAQDPQGQASGANTVGGLALDADTPVAQIVELLASATGDTEEVIRSIEDDKEHPAAAVILNLLIWAGYIIPPPLSVMIGIAIGFQYAGDLTNVLAWAILLVCVFYELGLIWLMFAVIKLARRFMASRSGFFGLFALVLAYLGIASGSAAAQWAIFEAHVNASEPAQVAGAIIRCFAVPIVDSICAIALPILTHVSLDKKLAEIQKKTDATIMLNKKKIAARLQIVQEAIVTKSTLQKEKDYQSKNDLANQLIEMISQKIINDARSSLTSSGNGYRRDNYR